MLDRADPLPAEEDLPAALKMAALENLAWGLQMLRRASLPTSSAEELLADFLRSDGRFEPAQARRALAWLREGCGLVTSGAALAFRHPAVQAVLVARAALADPERRALLFRFIEDPDGHAALVMFAGLAEPPLVREFFDRLLGAEFVFSGSGSHSSSQALNRCKPSANCRRPSPRRSPNRSSATRTEHPSPPSSPNTATTTANATGASTRNRSNAPHNAATTSPASTSPSTVTPSTPHPLSSPSSHPTTSTHPDKPRPTTFRKYNPNREYKYVVNRPRPGSHRPTASHAIRNPSCTTSSNSIHPGNPTIRTTRAAACSTNPYTRSNSPNASRIFSARSIPIRTHLPRGIGGQTPGRPSPADRTGKTGQQARPKPSSMDMIARKFRPSER